MKKIIFTTLVQSILFVLINTTLGYFFNKMQMSFYEYVFSQKTKMTVTFLLWFVIFFFVNKISKNGEITWKDIFKRKNEL